MVKVLYASPEPGTGTRHQEAIASGSPRTTSAGYLLPGRHGLRPGDAAHGMAKTCAALRYIGPRAVHEAARCGTRASGCSGCPPNGYQGLWLQVPARVFPPSEWALRGNSATVRRELVFRSPPAPLQREDRKLPRSGPILERNPDFHRGAEESTQRAGRGRRNSAIQD
jgi:hypothetical protein